MRVRVAAEQNGLIEHDGCVPHRWSAAEAGQHKLGEEWLDGEEQHRAAQHHRAEQGNLATPGRPTWVTGRGGRRFGQSLGLNSHFRAPSSGGSWSALHASSGRGGVAIVACPSGINLTRRSGYLERPRRSHRESAGLGEVVTLNVPVASPMAAAITMVSDAPRRSGLVVMRKTIPSASVILIHKDTTNAPARSW
jgi:hypothetical protein